MFLAGILLLVIASMGLVVLSPLALRVYDGDDIDWTRLNEIGGTYGAVSAVVATVALLGVMVSLVIQNREVREARKNARRAHHVELMRMAMDDARYMECWGPYLTGSFRTETQYTYVNLIVAHWYAEYEVGELSDDLLRATAIDVFASDPGRHYWQRTGTFWRDNYPGRQGRRFHQVLEDVYQDAIRMRSPHPAEPASPGGDAVAPEQTVVSPDMAVVSPEQAVVSPDMEVVSLEHAVVAPDAGAASPGRSRVKALAVAGGGAALVLVVTRLARRVVHHR